MISPKMESISPESIPACKALYNDAAALSRACTPRDVLGDSCCNIRKSSGGTSAIC